MNVPRGTVLKAKLAVQSANLRQISDAAKPLYDSLDDRQRRRLVQFVRIAVASPWARAKPKHVFALVDAGKTRQEASEELGISIRCVFRILRTRKDGENAPVALPVA